MLAPGGKQRHENPQAPQKGAELVREGIENDWPYIFTGCEFELFIEARLAEIKRGFDRIRERAPRC